LIEVIKIQKKTTEYNFCCKINEKGKEVVTWKINIQ